MSEWSRSECKERILAAAAALEHWPAIVADAKLMGVTTDQWVSLAVRNQLLDRDDYVLPAAAREDEIDAPAADGERQRPEP